MNDTLKIGEVTIERTAALAPMAGVADRAYRLMSKKYGAAYVISEMVSAKGICYNDRKTAELCTVTDEERPMAVQLFGNEPDFMAEAVKIVLDYSPDIIDINMGCPVPKVVGTGAGSALMKNVKLAADVVEAAVKAAGSTPVTVKIRSGWSADSINAPEMAKALEAAGAAAIAVHGRTRDMFYSGESSIDVVKAVKKAVSVPVIGNGDIINAEVEKKSIESDSGNYPGFGITLLYERNQVSFLDALIKTPSTTFQMVGAVFNSFGMLFSGQVSIRDISGPIGTIHYISEYAQTNWLYILLFLPLLSVNLAVFNILPIPSLDGARILFLLIEVIRRKPINKEIESRINSIGLIILFLFIIMVDIVNLLLA